MLDEAIEYLKQLQLQVQVSFLSLKMNNETLKHVKYYYEWFFCAIHLSLTMSNCQVLLMKQKAKVCPD
jgi:hypothetical protein